MGGGKKKEKKKNKALLYTAIKKRATDTYKDENDTEANPDAFQTEEMEEVSHELKEEKIKRENHKKVAKDLRNAMQNVTDSLLSAQPHFRNHLEGMSDFAIDEYIQGIVSGKIVPPVSYEDSDQSPVKVRFIRECCVFNLNHYII